MMKKETPVFILLFCGALLASCGGNNIDAADVPAPVINSFNAKYTNVTDAEWEREKKNGTTVYQVEFKANDKEIKAEFDANGGLLESKGD